MFHHYFHGIEVTSEISLGLGQESKKKTQKPVGSVAFVLTCTDPEVLSDPIWKSNETFPDGVPHLSLYLFEDHPLLEIARIGKFAFRGDSIICYVLPDVTAAAYLVGKVFGLWLELKGLPLLHGASLCHEGSAIGLLGYSGMGKSTLSSALWKRGCRLVTDDLIPILGGPPYLIDPGIPFSRMWPDTARFFIPQHNKLEKVHPDFEKVRVPKNLDGVSRFEEEPSPLRRLFILDRKLEPWEPSLELLNPASGLMELVRNSYHPDLVRALGLQPARMQKLATLMTSVPIFRLTYGSGFDKLDQVCDLIYANIKDLESVVP